MEERFRGCPSAAARKVLAVLTDPELIGYRALWNYLAGSAAWMASNSGQADLMGVAKEYFNIALGGTGSIGWLAELARCKLTGEVEPSEADDSQTIALVERLEAILDRLGSMHDQKYDAEEKMIMSGLNSNDSSGFEQAHRHLGTLLGFESGDPVGSGAPDAWWIIDENRCLIFEDHSDAKENSKISVSKARQAYTHPNWARKNLALAESAKIIPVLITSARSADKDALPHLEDVYLWQIDDFRKWAHNALGALRELRRIYPGSGDLMWRATVMTSYKHNRIDPKLLIQDIESRNAAEILKA